jgi:4-amino-4-deoxy-L-arabinose transferase-like glycosyltransferase
MILAVFLRFYALGSVPNSMNADEAAIGYNAYSILKTGRDEYGKIFPLLFQSFDDFKPPVYIYFTVPSVAVFGLRDMSVRLPSAVFGTLTVLATYFLVDALLGNSVIALLSALLLAISPWHLQFSRSAYESNLAVFFIVVGIIFLLRGLKQSILYVPAFLLLSLSVWTYHSSRVFIPLLIVVFTVIYFQEIRKKIKLYLLGFVLFMILCIPLLIMSLSSEGIVRARGVSALDNDELMSRNTKWIQRDEEYHFSFSHIYHNFRFVNFLIILKGYLEHFNPNFFFSEFVQGKYHAPGVSLMYLWELPFLVYGVHMMANKKGREKYLLFAWLLLAPLAAAPTRNLPHPVRTLTFLPVIQIITSYGIYELQSRIHSMKKIFQKCAIGLFIITVLLSVMYYLHQYYIHGPIDFAKDWQYGNEQTVKTANLMDDKFDKVVVSTSIDVPYMFFLYYLRYDPLKYLASGGTKSGKFDEERNVFDKYEFHKYIKSDSIINPRVLYIGLPKEVLPGAERLVTIKYPSGEDAYVISAEISKKDWNDAGNLPYLK